MLKIFVYLSLCFDLFQMARNEVVKRMWEIVKERKLEVLAAQPIFPHLSHDPS